jgi:hypothetical protein
VEKESEDEKDAEEGDSLAKALSVTGKERLRLHKVVA